MDFGARSGQRYQHPPRSNRTRGNGGGGRYRYQRGPWTYYELDEAQDLQGQLEQAQDDFDAAIWPHSMLWTLSK